MTPTFILGQSLEFETREMVYSKRIRRDRIIFFAHRPRIRRPHLLSTSYTVGILE